MNDRIGPRTPFWALSPVPPRIGQKRSNSVDGAWARARAVAESAEKIKCFGEGSDAVSVWSKKFASRNLENARRKPQRQTCEQHHVNQLAIFNETGPKNLLP